MLVGCGQAPSITIDQPHRTQLHLYVDRAFPETDLIATIDQWSVETDFSYEWVDHSEIITWKQTLGAHTEVIQYAPAEECINGMLEGSVATTGGNDESGHSTCISPDYFLTRSELMARNLMHEIGHVVGITYHAPEGTPSVMIGYVEGDADTLQAWDIEQYCMYNFCGR